VKTNDQLFQGLSKRNIERSLASCQPHFSTLTIISTLLCITSRKKNLFFKRILSANRPRLDKK
jgi:hypothetical protein